MIKEPNISQLKFHHSTLQVLGVLGEQWRTIVRINYRDVYGTTLLKFYQVNGTVYSYVS